MERPGRNGPLTEQTPRVAECDWQLIVAFLDRGERVYPGLEPVLGLVPAPKIKAQAGR